MFDFHLQQQSIDILSLMTPIDILIQHIQTSLNPKILLGFILENSILMKYFVN